MLYIVVEAGRNCNPCFIPFPISVIKPDGKYWGATHHTRQKSSLAYAIVDDCAFSLSLSLSLCLAHTICLSLYALTPVRPHPTTLYYTQTNKICTYHIWKKSIPQFSIHVRERATKHPDPLTFVSCPHGGRRSVATKMHRSRNDGIKRP